MGTSTLCRNLLRPSFDALLSYFVRVISLRLILTLQLESFSLLNITAALFRLAILTIIIVRTLANLNLGKIIEEFSELVALPLIILLNLGIHINQILTDTHQLKLDDLFF